MTDRARFFVGYRSQWGRIRSTKTVAGIEAVLDACEAWGLLLEQTAYTLASCKHESAHTFQPIEERGKGKGRDYGEAVLVYRGKRIAYYGRGLIQISWLSNVARASVALGVDYVNHPELLLTLEHSVRVTMWGLLSGAWHARGFGLGHYINADEVDYVEARRCVNGTDHAPEIAEIARRFEAILREAA